MKGNKIDDLFREKLSHQKLTPPPAAWAAVEKNLPGKSKKGIYFWVSIAASILLICALGWILIDSKSGSDITNPELTAQSNTKKQAAEERTEPENTVKAKTPADEVTRETPTPALKNLAEPAPEKLVASAEGKDIRKPAKADATISEEITTSISKDIKREVCEISPILPSNHLSVKTLAKDPGYGMIMPLMLSDYYTLQNEEVELGRRRKKFRVLNGIISIAKEVNSSKLSFSELRNAKNSFVNEDLKYGTKTDEDKASNSEDEDAEGDLNKD